MQRLTSIQNCVEDLIQNYNITKAFDSLSRQSESLYTIKEQLVFAFPGNYGLFLSLHFGRFLDETIDTKQKKTAYHGILCYLDDIDFYLSADLSGFLETISTLDTKGSSIAELQTQVSDSMEMALTDTESFLMKHQDKIEQYLAYKLSTEFKQSELGQMQQALLEFKNISGYEEKIIANMKILSSSYSEHLRQLEIANERFIEKFPSSKNIYDV